MKKDHPVVASDMADTVLENVVDIKHMAAFLRSHALVRVFNDYAIYTGLRYSISNEFSEDGTVTFWFGKVKAIFKPIRNNELFVSMDHSSCRFNLSSFKAFKKSAYDSKYGTVLDFVDLIICEAFRIYDFDPREPNERLHTIVFDRSHADLRKVGYTPMLRRLIREGATDIKHHERLLVIERGRLLDERCRELNDTINKFSIKGKDCE